MEQMRGRTTLWEWVPLLAILAGAAAIRFAYLDAQCLWFDELWHAELSTGRGSAHLRLPTDVLIENLPDLIDLQGAPPAAAIWRNMDLVTHPPLYHLVLRGWRVVAGDSAMAWRGLSAVCSLACLPLVYVAARRLAGHPAAIFSTLLAALSATQIAQARDTRGYPLAMLAALLTGVALLQIASARRAWPWVLAVGAGCFALPMIHYFSTGVVLGFAGFAAWQFSGRKRLAAVGAMVAGLGAFALAWGPTVWEQLACVEETADLFLAESHDGHLLIVLERVAALPARLVADIDPSQPAARVAMLAVGMMIWIGMFACASRRREALVWLLPLVATTMLLGGLDAVRSTRHLMFIRYAFAASPAVLVIIPAVATALSAGRMWRWGVAVGAVLLTAATLPFGYVTTPDFRPLAGHLQRSIGANDPVVLVSPNPRGRDGQTLYLTCAYYGRVFPRDVIIATQPLSPDFAKRLLGRTVWIAASNPATDPTRVAPGCEVLDRWRAGDGLPGAIFKVRLPADSR